MNGEKRPFFGKTDLIIAAALAAAAIAVFLVFFNSSGGEGVKIELDGKEYAFVKFSEVPENGEKDITVEAADGIVTVSVGNGYAYIKDSTCRGGDCLRAGRIDKPGRSIVCLPNRVTVTVTGYSEYDGRTG